MEPYRCETTIDLEDCIAIQKGFYMFDCAIVTNAVESNNVARMGYNYDHQIAEVEFKNGGRYRYANVPEEVYHAWWQAESKGSYMAKNIKGKYECQKWDEELKRWAELVVLKKENSSEEIA